MLYLDKGSTGLEGFFFFLDTALGQVHGLVPLTKVYGPVKFPVMGKSCSYWYSEDAEKERIAVGWKNPGTRTFYTTEWIIIPCEKENRININH